MVNPYSTGACIAREISKRTFNVVALWTKKVSEALKESCSDLKVFASVQEQDTLEETLAAVRDAAKPYRVIACICGGEEGTALTDALSEKLGVRTNGTQIKNRGNKKFQQDAIKEAGLRSIRQASGTKFSDVEEFLLNEKYPVVVKPSESIISDGVKLCHNIEEAKEHFEFLLTLQQKDGNDSCVLCQEFLKGKEYIVDHVSRDGLHKTASKYPDRDSRLSAFHSV